MRNFVRCIVRLFRRNDRLAVWTLASLVLLCATGFLLTTFGWDALRQLEAITFLSFAFGAGGVLYQVIGDQAKKTEKRKQAQINELDERFRTIDTAFTKQLQAVSAQVQELATKQDTRVDAVEAAIAVLREQYKILVENINNLISDTTSNRTAIEWVTRTDEMRRSLESIQLQLAGTSELQGSIQELSASIEELREKIACEQQ